MMKKMSIIIICVMMVVSLASCTIKEKDVNVVSRQMELKDFDAVMLAGSGHIEFEQDSVYEVSVEANDEVLKSLKIKVKNGTLEVEQKSDNTLRFSKHGDFTVKVKGPELRNVSIAGSGSVDVGKLETNTLRVTIAGSGTSTIKEVNAENIEASVAGSGTMHLQNVKDTKTIKLFIAGSGVIESTFDNCDYVNASVAGSGVISLRGNINHPYKADVSGSGEVVNEGMKVKSEE